MENDTPSEASSTTGPSSHDELDLDWDSCVQMARLLKRPPDATLAVAEILFRVNRDIVAFDDLLLNSAEPAVRFYAGWD